MPVRNGERYVDQAIASLVEQTFRDIEIIVIDNGSTDSTPVRLKAWVAREPRLRAERLDRANLAESLNHGATVARASLLARLDADDLAHPDRLKVQLQTMRSRPSLGVLGSGAELIDGDGQRLGEIRMPRAHPEIRERQRTSCSVIPSSSMMRAELFWRSGGYRKGLNISEDFDLWSRMTELCEAENLPDVLISYRIHSGSVTARQPVRMALASLCVTAAMEARQVGAPEPFTRGSPNLRLALPLLGMSRETATRMIRMRSASNVLARRLRRLPLPQAVKKLSPQLSRRLGLRRLYLKWLRLELRPTVIDAEKGARLSD
jgi:hypothetical protein